MPESPGMLMSRKTASMRARVEFRSADVASPARVRPCRCRVRPSRKASSSSAGASSSTASTRRVGVWLTAAHHGGSSAGPHARRGISAPASRPWCRHRSPFRRPDRNRCRTPRAADGRHWPGRRARIPSCRGGAARASPGPERSSSGSIPIPSSSTVITQSVPSSRAMSSIVPPPLACEPCRTAFSTSGCSARNGTTTLSTSGATCSRDLSARRRTGRVRG